MHGVTGIPWRYDRHERIADAVVHIVGLAFAVVGVGALVVATATSAPAGTVAAALIYGGGLFLALAASLAYNIWPVSPVKWVLRRLDHSAIFLLIAATYTPFLVQLPSGPTTTALFVGIWGTALAGVALKCGLPGRYDRLAILLYLGLGWSGALVFPAISPSLTTSTVVLVVIGGVVYSVGVIFHIWERLRFQNAIWHGFVMSGAAIHYAAVYDCLVLTPMT